MNRISPQSWEQAKAVFVEALEKTGAERNAYLDSTCGDDQALRAEVESLLRSFEVAGSFMESPAVESAAKSLIQDQPQLTTGQQIKHYEILGHIGEGGMGEVYLARDLMLGRRIALKFLPEYLRHDPDRMRRFKQEARAASTLSHPNVCVIHEVSETDDHRPFITMEYIEGVTLRQRLNEGPVDLDEALNIATQIADALAAAHEAGVVHRDIKPENIMIRRDGYVKVLDFGLAKLSDQRRVPNSTMSTLMLRSSPGMVMGTAAYMSPEQARGVATDARSDVWSLAVVLYEMVAAHAPFVGATPTDIVISIVEREQPPISDYVENVPIELERIVRKALRKDPEERYQLIKEMAIDLRSLQRDLQIDRSVSPDQLPLARRFATTASTIGVSTDELKATRRTVIAAGAQQSRLRTILAVAALGLVVAVAAFGYYRMSKRGETIVSKLGAFQQIDVTKLTTNGRALFASISPDGKYVAYVKDEGSGESLWLRQVGNAGNIELIPPRDGHYKGLIFSPEGNSIYYGYDNAGSDSLVHIFKVPTLGTGATPMKVDIQEGPMAISHDGKRKTFVRFDEAQKADFLKVANIDGSNEQVVLTRKWPDRLFVDIVTMPSWTNDDQNLLLPSFAYDGEGYVASLIEINLASHAEKKIALSPQRFESPCHVTVLADGTGVILSGRGAGASFEQVWFLGRDGSARTITNDLSDYSEANLTERSDAFVTVQRQTLANVFVSAKADAPTRATQVTAGLGRYFDISWTPDGKIVYASDASGVADIYEMSADGSDVKQLTSGVKRNYAPFVSPDNRYIVFHSNRAGNFQVWRMDRDGSNPIQLTKGSVESNWPCFSSDSKWVFFQHFDGGSQAIWKVSVDGGEPVKVVDAFAVRPEVSPDGQWLAYWQNDGNPGFRWKLRMVSLTNSAVSRDFTLPQAVDIQWDTQLRWSADSKSLTYLVQKNGVDNLWAQSIDGGPAKPVTEFKDSLIFAFDWSRNGSLAASRGIRSSDVVLITDKNKQLNAR